MAGNDNKGRRGSGSLAVAVLFFAAIFVAGWFTLNHNWNGNPDQVKAGRGVAPPYGLPSGSVLLGTEVGKITGLGNRGSRDTVMLYGKLYPDSNLYYKNLYLVLLPASKGAPIRLSIPKEASSGYGPKINLYDFTGDGLSEILLVSATGGSGGAQSYAGISVPEGKENVILDSSMNTGISVTGRYLPEYRAEVTVVETGKNYLLSLVSRKKLYDEIGIYKDGKLLQKVEPFAGPVGLVKPARRQGAGKVHNLRLYQQIKGTSGADAIAEVRSLWKYSGKGTDWKLLRAPLMPLNAKIIR